MVVCITCVSTDITTDNIAIRTTRNDDNDDIDTQNGTFWVLEMAHLIMAPGWFRGIRRGTDGSRGIQGVSTGVQIGSF